jgi:polyisoprenoid-binding protein YceI
MAIATQSFNGAYELDTSHSTVQFAVRHLELSTFRASFSDLSATLSANDDGIAIEARVGVESVSIVDPPEFREHVVRGGDFFDACAYPAITFRSTDVVLGDDGAATVTGDLTIRGVSHEVVARGTYRPRAQDPFGLFRVGLELRATVDRRAFGMDWQLPLPSGGDALGWDVELTAQLELVEAS